MGTIKRVFLAIGVVFGAILYVWFAAVRALPRVKRRKAELRARDYGPDRRVPRPDSGGVGLEE